MQVSVILPCQNEEAAIARCIREIKKIFLEHRIVGEIIVSDSSVDDSSQIAKDAGAILVKHDKDGYGNALREGFRVAKSDYIFFADADGTYDFSEIPRFLKVLHDGNNLVIGNRFSGDIEKGAMPFSHRYVGRPIFSWLIKIFFGGRISDVQSGMRAIKKEDILKLKLQTTGMEFASEMIVKALRLHFVIKEIPIAYRRRIGKSKLRTTADGWRHLRFILVFCPMKLFFMPGVIIFLFGFMNIVWLYFGQAQIFGVPLYLHPMFISSLCIIAGYQLIIFSLFIKTYAMTHFGERSDIMNRLYQYIRIDDMAFFGFILMLIAGILFGNILRKWFGSSFGNLHEQQDALFALTLGILGFQTFFSSFMLSILGIQKRNNT